MSEMNTSPVRFMCMQSQRILLPHVLKWHADLQKKQNKDSEDSNKTVLTTLLIDFIRPI